ncbi:winged helix-turn-helix transcriptional regulator [Halalkalicoccus jeotgali]|uniref:Transcriptional regulator, AsnC family protein n=2 Tax=Halobacteriales TaxID=2235 RepID=D8JAX8_HALJB|nr:winged helix-turn-helix transcriptional regulator [Halalkalicoccus jeotgali]ADJ16431.1 putative transcriptional regulator, AsnC family protein [Halalkalicoccus jeotgali B3]ADJ17155.1 putative transcriptional regulator, AsnC family protein [Halalkalicoccus jeotgali B3]ELY41150.1 putative transcriptional regulator, AsnC family protein [Halalkalicoccus jeotgali B3]
MSSSTDHFYAVFAPLANDRRMCLTRHSIHIAMTGIDDVDYEIIELLMENARHSYREIAKQVDRSPPTVSDRVERLQEIGVIERFTLDIDRSILVEGPSVLVELDVEPNSDETVANTLADTPAVEHIIRTLDATVLFVAHGSEQDIRALLSETLDGAQIRSYTVRLVSESTWKPQLGAESVSMECTVCGKSVDDGETVELGEQTHEVCCTSCASKIKTQYDELKEAAASE